MKLLDTDLEMALSYKAYASYAQKLLYDISQDTRNLMSGYARTNLQILRRLKRSVSLTEELQTAIRSSPPMIFLILTEGYCGDSAQTFPIFGKMQEAFPEKIEIKVVLRDGHPEIADTFFRTRAIPMLICLDRQTLTEKFIWGNRPGPAQQIMDDLKSRSATPEQKAVALHRWYARDKTLTLQKELELNLLNSLSRAAAKPVSGK